MRRGPTTSSRRFGLFRLVNVDRLFRKSKSAAHDHGPKSFGAHIGALDVWNTSACLSFPLRTPSQSVTEAGPLGNAKVTDLAGSLSPHFPTDMNNDSLQGRHNETRRKQTCFNQ